MRKISKYIFLLIFIAFSFCTLNGNTVYAVNVPNEVKLAAESGLVIFKNMVSENPNNYGYLNLDEVNKTVLGDGFKIKYVNPNKLKKSDNESLSELVDDTNCWEFIALVDGKPKSFITIGKINGEYKLIQFGGNPEKFYNSFKKYNNTDDKNLEPQIIKMGNENWLIINNNIYA
ncbi:hypothetical protein GOM49_07095 [Clostridium bovifaecis]|uniref:Lipoprotein n=1 Tax=Clostridium bovifaecis TaxID=2184719 RepID=A0A6I6F2D8_9CLOT|nr:hypothetical protein GOM49_07095 [Clostridium bovifaecis]